jgi:hypothetical protein
MTDNNEMELEEILLYSSRHGDLNMVKELLASQNEGKISVNISCKGKQFACSVSRRVLNVMS